MSLLVVGSVAYDSIQTPFGKVKKTLGGSASYFSLAARFFTRPSLIAVVGDDFKSNDADLFKKHKIDISGLEKTQGKTFHWAGKYHYDLNTRDTLKTELGVFEKFNPRLAKQHQQADYVFLGNIHPKLQLLVLNQIKRPKLVGLDTMNFWIDTAKNDLLAVIKKIDLLAINEAEARQLSGESNLVKAAKKILKVMGGQKSDVLIIKQGEYGLLMFSHSTSLRVQPKQSHQGKGLPRPSDAFGARNDINIFNLPGYPLEKVIDPTGAGDSFAGGTMAYLAANGDLSWNSLKKACVAGSALASFCVEELGVKKLTGLTLNEVKKRIKVFQSLTR